MLLILKMDGENQEIEIGADEIGSFVDILRGCTIIDPEGSTWKIAPAATLYFDTVPPHFEIDCIKES